MLASTTVEKFLEDERRKGGMKQVKYEGNEKKDNNMREQEYAKRKVNRIKTNEVFNYLLFIIKLYSLKHL